MKHLDHRLTDQTQVSKGNSEFSQDDSIDDFVPRSMPVSKKQPGLLINLALMQAVATAVFSLLVWLSFDSREGLSAAFGGSIAMLGSLYSAGRLFTTKQDASASEMLARFYASVVLKIVFTLAMMVICITVLKVSLLPFIIAYIIAAVIVNWLMLLVPAQLDEVNE